MTTMLMEATVTQESLWDLHGRLEKGQKANGLIDVKDADSAILDFCRDYDYWPASLPEELVKLRAYWKRYWRHQNPSLVVFSGVSHAIVNAMKRLEA